MAASQKNGAAAILKQEIGRPLIIGLKVAAFIAPVVFVFALASRLSGK